MMTPTTSGGPGRASARAKTRLAGAVLVSAAAIAGLTACAGSQGGAAGAGSSSSAGSSAAAASAPSGFTAQTFTIEVNAPSSLNPALGPIGETASIYTYLAYGSLIFQEQNGTYVPDLATSWGYVPGSDNEKFTLTIRSGVKFSDGSAFTAQAVVNSIKYFKSAGGPQAQQLADMTAATATGAQTVELDFSAPTPNLPFLFSQTQGLGAIMGPQGLANPALLSKQSDGAGPYTISSADVIDGSQYTYNASPTYYNPAAVHFHQVVVKVMTDQNAILSGLQSGAIQAAFPSAMPEIVQPAKAAGLNVEGAPFGIFTLILADRGGSISPLGNLAVRQAINYALDRSQFAPLIGGSLGVATNQLATTGAVGYSAQDASAYAFNVTKAKQLLASAGYPNGFTLAVVDPDATDPNAIVGQAVVEALAKINIKVNLTAVPQFSQFIPAALSKKYPAILFATPYFGDGYYYASRLALGSFENPFNSDSPVVDKLYQQAAATTDATQQKALLGQVASWFSANAWFAPIAGSIQNEINTSAVQGVQPTTAAVPGIWSPFGPTASLSWYTK